MQTLELLAPARTAEIGIAAIDCGADAVYIAGPAFGARQAAGNSVEDLRRLCAYAHRFGVRIFVTFNTLIYEEELSEARELLRELAGAGADAFIVQDPAVRELAPEGTILHASTQCAIRTPEDARLYESMGFGRLVLERELSLEQIRAIRAAVGTELECFVHGALCVCYSGQCYLSEYLAGRSANRGECIQACRSLYDLEDASGRVLVRNKALLSLKDFNLLSRLQDLAEAGAMSFKIEGRLKSASYVKNVVRAYSDALDALVERYPDRYRRASFGTLRGGFTPDLEKTFHRGYTELFLDGKRGEWSSMDAPTSLGEPIGTVERLRPDGVLLRPARPGITLHNGDGFSFVARSGAVVGFRGDVCQGNLIRCKRVEGLREGTPLYRNVDAAFEKTLEADMPRRLLRVRADIRVSGGAFLATAVSEDGREVSVTESVPTEPAENQPRMEAVVREQIGKQTGHYLFTAGEVEAPEGLPYLKAAFLNGVRRSLSERLDEQPERALPLQRGTLSALEVPETLTYKANIANSLTLNFYRERGARVTEPAYEIAHPSGAELMRTKYCVRHECGLCPRERPGTRPEPLYLKNNGRSLRLDFDCARCEMTVKEATSSAR